MQQVKESDLRREVDEAVRVLHEGGIILYPTDTVWGLGCDATNAEAVDRIYRLKRSENKKSMLVLCASADMVVRYVNRAPGIAFEVMEMATSPLTLILPGATGVAANLIPDEGRSASAFPTTSSAAACSAPCSAPWSRPRPTSRARQPRRAAGGLARDHRRRGLRRQPPF